MTYSDTSKSSKTKPIIDFDIDPEKNEVTETNFEFAAEKLQDAPIVHDPDNLSRRINRKIDLRFVPFGMVIFFFSILDRSNISNAFIMNQEKGVSLGQVLGMTPQNNKFNISLCCFYIAELLAVPITNQLMHRLGGRYFLGILVIGWGTVAMLMSTVTNYAGFVVLRTLLGLFEAGLFPGLVFASSFWYRQSERSARISLIISASSIASAFGGAIAYGVQRLEGVRGKHAWEWLFIVEGAPTILAGIICLFFFPDAPEKVSFLTPEERAWAIRRLGPSSSRVNDKESSFLSIGAILQAMKSAYLWLHWIAFATISAAFVSFNSFTAPIISGLNVSSLNAQLLSVPPYVLAFAMVLIFCPLADKKNIRAYVIVTSTSITAIMFLCLAIIPSPVFKIRYALFCVAVGSFFVAVPVLLSWATTNSNGTESIAVAVGQAFWLSDIFQVAGSWVYRPANAPLYRTGHYINFGLLTIAAISALGTRILLVRSQKGKQKTVNTSMREGDSFLAL